MRLPPDKARCPGCREFCDRHCPSSRQCNWYPCVRCQHTIEGTWLSVTKPGRLGRRWDYVMKKLHPRLPEGFAS